MMSQPPKPYRVDKELHTLAEIELILKTKHSCVMPHYKLVYTKSFHATCNAQLLPFIIKKYINCNIFSELT